MSNSRPESSSNSAQVGGDFDLSQHLVREGDHYIAIGERADLWKGKLSLESSGKPIKVAIKVLRGGSASNRQLMQRLTTLLNEHGNVWKHFDHPNVAHFYGLAFNCGSMPALVLTYYPKGNIMEYLKETKPSDESKFLLIQQVAKGMQYLHEFTPPVIHGDIRGANILIDADGHAVLADYGLAFIIESSDFTSIKTAGTCRWTAPEVMNPPEDETEMDDPLPPFTMASDVYAFGMTVTEIFSGAVPFSKKKNDSAVIFAVLADHRPDLPPSLTEGNETAKLGELVQRCWKKDPTDRPTAKTICEALGINAASRSQFFHSSMTNEVKQAHETSINPNPNPNPGPSSSWIGRFFGYMFPK